MSCIAGASDSQSPSPRARSVSDTTKATFPPVAIKLAASSAKDAELVNAKRCVLVFVSSLLVPTALIWDAVITDSSSFSCKFKSVLNACVWAACVTVRLVSKQAAAVDPSSCSLLLLLQSWATLNRLAGSLALELLTDAETLSKNVEERRAAQQTRANEDWGNFIVYKNKA